MGCCKIKCPSVVLLSMHTMNVIKGNYSTVQLEEITVIKYTTKYGKYASRFKNNNKCSVMSIALIIYIQCYIILILWICNLCALVQ